MHIDHSHAEDPRADAGLEVTKTESGWSRPATPRGRDARDAVDPIPVAEAGAADNGAMSPLQVDAAIARLEQDMADLQHRHRDLFSFANAWAERYDALVADTPADLQAATQARLQRIGVRWGVAQGVRATAQFPVLKPPRG